MRFTYYIIIGMMIIISSCKPSPNLERHFSNINLDLPDEYKILDFKSDWSIGESTENYRILISPSDYNKIIEEIKEKTFFRKLDTARVPLYALDNTTNLTKINETACWYDNKYFYQIFNPNPGILVTVELESDSIMIIEYEDL